MKKYFLLLVLVFFLVSCSNNQETTTLNDTTTTKENSAITTTLDNIYTSQVDDILNVSSISFSKYGNKYYFVGEEFDPTGYYINVEYSDGDIKEYSLDTYPIQYEIKYNILCVSLLEFYTNYQLVYGYDVDDWLYSTYNVYPVYYSYFEPYKYEENFEIIYLSNEESLKNKTYRVEDFEVLKCISFEEITIERYKEIKLSSDRNNFYRFFKIYINPDDIQDVHSYLLNVSKDDNSNIYLYKLH